MNNEISYTDIVTASEITAYQIMGIAGQVKGWNTTAPANIHEVANNLIALAERIKSERAVCAMK